jgi:hypothetical protein
LFLSCLSKLSATKSGHGTTLVVDAVGESMSRFLELHFEQ